MRRSKAERSKRRPSSRTPASSISQTDEEDPMQMTPSSHGSRPRVRRPRASSSDHTPSKPRQSKLHANRVRRQHERSNENDELEQRFSHLAVSSTPRKHPEPSPSRVAPAKNKRPLPSKRTTNHSTSQAKSRASFKKKDAAVGSKRRGQQPTNGTTGPAFSWGASKDTTGSGLPSTSVTASEATAEPLPGSTHRARSSSNGSDSDYSSDDDVYPDDATRSTSAFPQRLTLFTPQKRIPKRVSHDAVIDTIFKALFKKPSETADSRATGQRSAFGFGDDTGTDTDEPNEEFVKRGLAASLFKDGLGNPLMLGRHGYETEEQAIEHFITPHFIHTLVTDMRFEDFRTASARIDVLRAIHKNCPQKRLHIARALVDASHLRWQYVKALTAQAHALGVERDHAIKDHPCDHSHGFVELLRYAIEHVGEVFHGFIPAASDTTNRPKEAEIQETIRNYSVALLYLWRTHWIDPSGSDEEEIISCAGQFVAYMPQLTLDVIERLLQHWPTRYPANEVHAIRMLARVLMTSPPLLQLDKQTTLHLRIFQRLATCIQSLHAQVAQEALAFTGCQFVLVHFVGAYPAIYTMISEALHTNMSSHWNDKIRTTSEANFDAVLDFA